METNNLLLASCSFSRAVCLNDLSHPSPPFFQVESQRSSSHRTVVCFDITGGCFTACVLALALPGEKRIQKWARAKGEIKGSSDYSDLIFVLVWSSLAQFSLIITCVVALLAGGTNVVYPPTAPFYQYLSIGTATLIFNYAALELFTVIDTLMRVGIVIMFEESRD